MKVAAATKVFLLCTSCGLLVLLLVWESGQIRHSHITVFPFHLYHAQQEPYKSSPCHPQRLHLAQRTNVGDNDSVAMTLSFMIDYEKCKYVQIVVAYGSGWDERFVDATMPQQFNYSSHKSQGIFQSDWIYHVELEDLKAGSISYWYQVTVQQKLSVDQSQPKAGPGEEPAMSHTNQNKGVLGRTKRYVFRTPPLPGSPTRFAMVGDLGQTDNSARTMHHIWRGTFPSLTNSVPISHILIAGDLSYADSDPLRWNSWLDLMEPLFRTTPLHVAAGNHEIECSSNGDLFLAYENYFYNPNRIGPADIQPYKGRFLRIHCSAPSVFQAHYNFGNAFYSYDHGLAHVMVLSSYSDATVGSVQYQWLEQDLKAYDRLRTPWLLVSFHAPLYTTFWCHVNEKEAILMKEAMEPLFSLYGVNFVVSGHDHGYMRTHPMYNGQVDKTGKAPVYLTLGAGGNREGHCGGYQHNDAEEWIAVRTLVDYGYGNLFLPNATHASFTWVRDATEDGGIHDHVWFTNPHVAMP